MRKVTVLAAEPTETDLARLALRNLQPMLDTNGPVTLRVNGNSGEILVPGSAFAAFAQVLESMARGESVSVLPLDAEMTTHQAAAALNVSRPYLIGLLEAGAIEFRMVGSHRRINAESLLNYKEREYKRSKAIADALSADAFELGFIR
jgi:excisionase family DNA binding protein